MSISSPEKFMICACAAALLALTSISGCSQVRNFSLKPYKINIQQGNFLDHEDIDQIEPGMTRSQVRFLLGTPMVADIFNENRWDYVYYLKVGRTGDIFRRHFIVYFEGDETIRVERRTDTVPQRQG
jgi:outer membrane protein assembly factor BamE